jgi:1-acyl-sn-glycerol-3-phosphate acyltransferase
MLTALFALWFRIAGWKIKGSFPHHIPKLIVAVGPHTSAWDFVVGAAARKVMKIQNARFLGKKELFDGPLGWFFRSMGGIPVDRSSPKGLVDQVVEQIEKEEVFRLGMSPEGTRKKVEQLKTGFYRIALQANIQIILIGLDFSKKEVVIGPLITPSENIDEDLKKVIQFFKSIKGKNPEMGI